MSESRYIHILTDDMSAFELIRLTEASGCFEWLGSAEEDVYTIEDGEEIVWPSECAANFKTKENPSR